MNILKRQGDILLERVDTEIKLLRPVDDNVIAHGETTGHAHKVVDGELVHSQSGMVVVAEGGTTVVHEEHDSLELEDGIWLVHRQTEYVSPGETATVYD